jgi:hypothetical protein
LPAIVWHHQCCGTVDCPKTIPHQTKPRSRPRPKNKGAPFASCQPRASRLPSNQTLHGDQPAYQPAVSGDCPYCTPHDPHGDQRRQTDEDTKRSLTTPQATRTRGQEKNHTAQRRRFLSRKEKARPSFPQESRREGKPRRGIIRSVCRERRRPPAGGRSRRQAGPAASASALQPSLARPSGTVAARTSAAARGLGTDVKWVRGQQSR